MSFRARPVLIAAGSTGALVALTAMQSLALSAPAVAEVPASAWSGTHDALRLDDHVAGVQVPLFSLSGLVAGHTGERCVAVDLDTDVVGDGATLSLHVEESGGVQTLADGITMVVEAGTGGSFASCAGFVPSGPSTTATLAQLHTTTVDAPVLALAAAATTSYRFSFTIADDNRFQGTTAGADLVWTVR